MDMNRFTEKSQEALQAAHRLAARLGHQQIDVEHLLLSLLDQEHGEALGVCVQLEAEASRLAPNERAALTAVSHHRQSF